MGQGGPNGVAVGGGHLYWANTNAGTIVQANLNGTDVKTIAKGQSFPGAVAVGCGHLYWSSEERGTIVEANLDGNRAKTIVRRQLLPFWVAVDSSHLYWDNSVAAGTIVEANLNGTGARPSPRAEHPYGWRSTTATSTGQLPVRHDRRGQAQRQGRQGHRQRPEARVGDSGRTLAGAIDLGRLTAPAPPTIEP